jgi:hypothetical protein
MRGHESRTIDVNRSKEMYLLNEDLARAQYAQRLEEAQRRQRVQRLVAARRASRRAEEAALRARRLLALAVAR